MVWFHCRFFLFEILTFFVLFIKNRIFMRLTLDCRRLVQLCLYDIECIYSVCVGSA